MGAVHRQRTLVRHGMAQPRMGALAAHEELRRSGEILPQGHRPGTRRGAFPRRDRSGLRSQGRGRAGALRPAEKPSRRLHETLLPAGRRGHGGHLRRGLRLCAQTAEGVLFPDARRRRQLPRCLCRCPAAGRRGEIRRRAAERGPRALRKRLRLSGEPPGVPR